MGKCWGQRAESTEVGSGGGEGERAQPGPERLREWEGERQGSGKGQCSHPGSFWNPSTDCRGATRKLGQQSFIHSIQKVPEEPLCGAEMGTKHA